MALITDPDQLSDGTEITINTATRTFELNSGTGNMDDDGATLQAIYSFFKEDWKDDPNTKNLIAYPFPMVAITPEQFEFIFNWEPIDDVTRKLIRTGGWREIDTDDNNRLKQEYVGVITLGTFVDNVNDLAYYQTGDDPSDTTAAVDFEFAGPVNEAILSFDQSVGPSSDVDFTTNTITRGDAGNFLTDGFRVGGQVTVSRATNSANNGTFLITDVTATVITVTGTPFTASTEDNTVLVSVNYRNALQLFLRVRDNTAPNGRTFAQANLADIGVTSILNQVYRFPLANAVDLQIENVDGDIETLEPYTEIGVKYFPTAYSRPVDDPLTTRDFGIVIDVGTHTGVDGATTATGDTLTSAEGGIPADFDGGTLRITTGPNEGTYTVASTTATTVTITTTFPDTSTGDSFSLQRSSPVTATAEEIYEKVQYLLRQAANINTIDGVVTGNTADALLQFVGDNLNAGTGIPSNPNGGGSGVYINGFDPGDTNRLFFVDNNETTRQFPFVAAGNINFNDNLVNDGGPARYTMFYQYTRRTNVSDLEITGATGFTGTLESAGGNLPTTVAQNDHIRVGGFSNPANNGIYVITDASPSATAITVSKLDERTISNEGPVSGQVDENPIDSPDAIVVEDNDGSPIAGNITAPSTSFDYDYDGNTQGGRTAGTDASIVIRAIGLDTAQFVETSGTISRTVGLVFTLVAALERNYISAA